MSSSSFSLTFTLGKARSYDSFTVYSGLVREDPALSQTAKPDDYNKTYKISSRKEKKIRSVKDAFRMTHVHVVYGRLMTDYYLCVIVVHMKFPSCRQSGVLLFVHRPENIKSRIQTWLKNTSGHGSPKKLF